MDHALLILIFLIAVALLFAGLAMVIRAAQSSEPLESPPA